MNKFTVDLPEAFKGIFNKNQEPQTPNKKTVRTEPTDNTEASLIFDTDSSKINGTLTNIDILTTQSSPLQKETRLRNRTEHVRREALYSSRDYHHSVTGNTTESERLETSPGYLERPYFDTEQSFRLQVSPASKKFPGTPSSRQSQVFQGNESLFAFRPQTRLDLDAVTPSMVKKQSDHQPIGFPRK